MKRHVLTMTALLGALLSTSLVGCGTEADVIDSGSEDGAVAVLPGKADDYLSPTSREWLIGATGTFTLGDEDRELSADEKEARANELLGYEFKAHAHFVNVYMTDKTSHDDNDGYGEFGGLVRDKSLDYLVLPVDGTDDMEWEFVWTIEMGGPSDLLKRLDTYTQAGETTFDVQLPVLSASDLERSRFPKNFDPKSYDGELETIAVTISPVSGSVDAFPEYNALFADGVFDVMILIGGDYNEKRYDLIAAEQIFDWLKQAGYEHRATDYTELTLDSEPFTRTIRAAGQTVDIRVTLLHPDIVEDKDLDDLRAAIITGFETMDMVIYDGHAGQDPGYSGISYHYEPRHAISANDLAKLNLPEKYQVYVFNGCKTYNAYPDALYQNETKTTKNLDIISTVSFSWLSMQPFTTSGLMNQMLRRQSGEHDPQTWVEILTQINKSNNYNVFYGVHGLDDNPRLNPYTDQASLCGSCGSDNDCPGIGNRCVRFDWGRACAAECTDDAGCPSGYRCAEIASGYQITGRQCLPQTYVCE